MRATISSLPPPLPLRLSGTWRDGGAVGREGTRRLARLAIWQARRPWLAATGVLAAAACFCALVQGPQWRESAALATVNLAVALLFVFTGLMLGREPGQRVTACALMLAGLFRCVDFIDAWNGPWHAYTLVFGGVDRLFGAWALLRYPNSALSRLQRRYLAVLAGWMLAGRTLIAVTSTAQWNGDPPSWWWPALVPDQQLSDALNYVVHGGEGLCGIGLMALLMIRLIRTRGLDRIVITPIIVAGIAAVIAAIVSATMMMFSLSSTPNGAYLVEGVVDFAIPVAFLIAVLQRLLLIKNVTELTAQVAAGGDIARCAARCAASCTIPPWTCSTPRSPACGRSAAGHPGGLSPTSVPGKARPSPSSSPTRSWPGTASCLTPPRRPAALRCKTPSFRRGPRRRSSSRSRLHGRGSWRPNSRSGGASSATCTTACSSTCSALRPASPPRRPGRPIPRRPPPSARPAMSLKAVLAELRDLAHGIHPAVLSQSGLGAALEEVTERLPLPVCVRVPARRLDAAVEATLYFVACEALANVVKHANAGSALVTVRVGGSVLEMVIADDGIGGVTADAQSRAAGSEGRHGLANMADRVGALDGEVVIESPPGRGTRLVVRVPCG